MTAYEDGIRAYQSLDYKTAFEQLLPCAEQANAEAQCLIGTMYEEGWGVTQDFAAAFLWYRKAADQGHATAQFCLAGMYDKSGEYAVAAMWLRKAADQRHAGAQFNLGVMCEKGEGVRQDDIAAVSWYRRAADRGYAVAECNLGVMYEEGRGGLPKDDCAAARLYKLAADKEHAGAQLNLGVMYEQGRGSLPQDDRQAARLYKLAADKGYGIAQRQLGIFYEQGRGGLRKDDREALRLYKLGNEWARDRLKALSAAGEAADFRTAASQANNVSPSEKLKSEQGIERSAPQNGSLAEWFKNNASFAETAKLVALLVGLLIAIVSGLLFGVFGFLISLVALGLGEAPLEKWSSWAACTHGVPGGSTHKCCEKCLQKKQSLRQSNSASVNSLSASAASMHRQRSFATMKDCD